MNTLEKRDTIDLALDYIDSKEEKKLETGLNAENNNEETPDESPDLNTNYVATTIGLEEPVTVAENAKLTNTPTRNTFAAKKTVAQGMMDIALITANANQLRYVLEFQSNNKTFYFYFNIVLIVISLILQVFVGLALIFKGRLDIQGKGKSETGSKINNFVVIGVFLVTIINVFIASFTITSSPANPVIPIVPSSP